MNAPLDTRDPTTRDRRIVTRLRGQITNISAGGFALVLHQNVPAQVLIRVTLDLETETAEPFEVDARIVGTTSLPGGRCLVRAAYYETENEKREIIAQYVIHRQQQQQHESGGTTE
jgi:c-di-GMP-binding flagellar brake protein YcgR